MRVAEARVCFFFALPVESKSRCSCLFIAHVHLSIIGFDWIRERSVVEFIRHDYVCENEVERTQYEIDYLIDLLPISHYDTTGNIVHFIINSFPEAPDLNLCSKLIATVVGKSQRKRFTSL